MKAILSLCVLILVCLSAASAQIAGPILQSATKITYTTNTVEISDSVATRTIVVRKNDIRVMTVGESTGATATVVDKSSGRVIFSKPVARVRIVGVAANDAAKVTSLKTTPFN